MPKRKNNNKLRPKFRLLKGIFSVFLLLALLLISTIIVLIAYFNSEIPDHRILYSLQPQKISKIYTSQHNLIDDFGRDNRAFVPLEYIPKSIQNAFLIAEDRNFYEHGGLDFKGILRAIFNNLKLSLELDTGSLQGGSTITQQIAKNIFLSQDKTFERKIKEAILANRINQSFSKEKILEIYLNNTFLGSNSYGVVSSAKKYFNKKLEDLTIAEIALLAGIPKAPSKFNPIRNYDNAINRRNIILHMMRENHLISDAEFINAINEKVVIKNNMQKSPLIADKQYFRDALLKELRTKLDENKIESGALSIFSTLDEKTHKLALKTFQDNLVRYSKSFGFLGKIGKVDDFVEWESELKNKFSHLNNLKYNDDVEIAAILRIDAKNNEIIIGLSTGKVAVIPLPEFDWMKRAYKTNYVIDENGEKQSSLKPIQEVLSLGDIILVQKNNKAYTPVQIPIINGAMIVANAKTGEILSLIGGFNYQQSQFNRALSKRKLGTLINPFLLLKKELLDDSKVMKSSEENLLNIVEAFLVFANSGVKIPLTSINFVQDNEGETVYKTIIKKDQLFETSKIENLNKNFEDKINEIQYVGINGITRENFDSWYIGYNSDVVVGVYVGYDKPQNIADIDILNVPKKIFLDFITSYSAK
jgi:penicillin-binding protein 1A